MKVKIDIETQTFVRFGLVIIGFVLALMAINLAQGALITIGIAMFLALALNPPVTALAKRLPGKSRVGATAIAYLIVVAIIGAILFLVVPPIVQQTGKFATTVPSLIDKALEKKPLLDSFVAQYNLRDALDQATNTVKSQIAGLSTQMAGIAVSIVTGAFGWIVNAFFVLILGFFMLIEGPAWMKKIWDLYQDAEKREMHKASVEKMYRVVTGFVTGQISVAAIGASFVFLTVFVMSLFPGLQIASNLALPLAAIVFVMELIPMVGAPLATILTGLILLLNSTTAAILFVVIYLVYQQIENNVIAPHIQSKNVELSILWILMALLIGSSIFGLIGGLISIPIAGCLRILLIDYLDYAKKRREKTTFKSALKRAIKGA
jgi:predicted PurR-regulated permease PerM